MPQKPPQHSSRIIVEMLLGAVPFVLLLLAVRHFAWIATHIDENVLIVLLILVAIGLFVVREIARLTYGIFEILIGVVAVFAAITRAVEAINDPALANQIMVQSAAGLYIIVRGIDNIWQSKPFKEMRAGLKKEE
jgi:hypothetical protein